jgi:ABC-2 type transport system permease protein
MVQRLNGLQATAVRSADDAARSKDPIADRRTRISADFWKTIPDFHFAAPAPAARATIMAPALLQLAFWLAAATGLLVLAARRLRGHGG